MNWLRRWLCGDFPESGHTEIPLQEIDLGENDILVLQTDRTIAAQHMDRMSQMIKYALENKKRVLVLEGDFQFKVIRRKASELATH